MMGHKECGNTVPKVLGKLEAQSGGGGIEDMI